MRSNFQRKFTVYMTKNQVAEKIKFEAKKLGFDFVGIAAAGLLEDEAKRLENWLSKGFNGQMGYMENHFDKRLDPTKLVPGAKSVISLMYNYYSPEKQTDPTAPKLSKYAYGTDYHLVIKDKLKRLVSTLQTHFGEINGRVFVDSAPVMERAWAAKSGLGWVGKHSLLINKGHGSYFFIAEIISDLEAEPDAPTTNHCGTCTACIDACPTQAITPYEVDGSKCISYLTIELKEELPKAFNDKMDNWMFGCDVCQDVCPWNRFSKPHNEPEFMPHPDLLKLTKSDWEELTQDVFNTLFQHSAVKRTKFKGLIRNISFLKQGIKKG